MTKYVQLEVNVMHKTIRLVFPEWQGGVNPNYYMGSKLLSWLIPENENQEKIEVTVATNFEDEEPIIDGVSWKNELVQQQKEAMRILKEKSPEKVIVLGGDCSVEQAPIDYLHGQYPEDIAIIWIDAHPDFSEPADFSHEHAMVLGNLMGGGAPEFAAMVENPFEAKDVMYAGLVFDRMETWEQVHYNKYSMAYATPEDLEENNDKVINWIKDNGYKHVFIHWDLDALTPKDFYSLLCNEPSTPEPEYAVGKMTLTKVIQLIQDIAKTTDVVGLGITEFMPWDVIRLQQSLKQINIFND